MAQPSSAAMVAASASMAARYPGTASVSSGDVCQDQVQDATEQEPTMLNDGANSDTFFTFGVVATLFRVDLNFVVTTDSGATPTCLLACAE
ncbi:hypothetical protein CCR81_03630 [Halorhodospira halophila]|nr:hypothetical protein [Halorhodospira halophila]